MDGEHRIAFSAVTITLQEDDRRAIASAQERRTDASSADPRIQTDHDLGVPERLAFESIGDRYIHDPSTVSVLPGIEVDGASGVAYRSRSPLREEPLRESFISDRNSRRYRAARWRPWHRHKRRRVRGQWVSLVSPRAHHNLYHFIVETLPRAAAVRSTWPDTDLKLLVPADRAPFWDDVLAALSSRWGAEIQPVTPGERIEVEQLALVDLRLKDMCGFVHPDAATALRELMSAAAPADGQSRAERIFVSRAGATRRCVDDESALHPVLDRHGFEIVRAEELPFKDQVRLFAGARIVVAPHGAGLANLVFTPRASVLVLQGREQSMPHYLVLCASLGLPYREVTGPVVNSRGAYTIDVDEFSKTLAEVIADDDASGD